MGRKTKQKPIDAQQSIFVVCFFLIEFLSGENRNLNIIIPGSNTLNIEKQRLKDAKNIFQSLNHRRNYKKKSYTKHQNNIENKIKSYEIIGNHMKII